MRKIAISIACALALASCVSDGDDPAAALARQEAAIKKSCGAAEVTLAAIEPWALAGRLNAKTTRIVDAAKTALFEPDEGICVVPVAGNLTALLVRVSSFALTLSVALNDAKKQE